MAVVFALVRDRPFDITDFSVSEEATPLVPGEGGSIPNLTFTARAIEDGPLNKRNTMALTGSIRLEDRTTVPGPFHGRGRFMGENASTRTTEGVVTVNADSLLVAFNQDVTALALTNPSETVGSAFIYYASLVGLRAHQINISVEYATKPFVAPSWTGNAWTYVLDFCVAVGCELSVRGDIIYMHPPRLRTLNTENISELEVTTTKPIVVDRLTTINYNTKRDASRVFYTAESTYTVTAGGITETIVDYANADLTYVNNPQPRTHISDTTGGSIGQYVVYDSENNLVDPFWWERTGGRITAELGEVPGTINLTIFGAAGKGPYARDYIGPFTIGEYRTGELEAALILTGNGVFTEPETIEVLTGAEAGLTEVTPENIDNIFFSDFNTAYTRSLAVATQQAGLGVELSGFMPFDITIKDGQEFGVIPGSRVQVKDNVFRITEVTYTIDGIDFSAKSDMLFDDLFDLYADTFDEANKRYAGLTFDSYNVIYPAATTFDKLGAVNMPTFDDVEYIYEGISLIEQSAYPYIRTAIYAGVALTMDEVNERFRGKTFNDFNASLPMGTTFRDLNRKYR